MDLWDIVEGTVSSLFNLMMLVYYIYIGIMFPKQRESFKGFSEGIFDPSQCGKVS